MSGRFSEHHAFMVGQYLGQIDATTAMIDQLKAMIDRLTARIEEAMEPFRSAREALTTIPGASVTVADVVIAKIGTDMAVFHPAGDLASWAGVRPARTSPPGA